MYIATTKSNRLLYHVLSILNLIIKTKTDFMTHIITHYLHGETNQETKWKIFSNVNKTCSWIKKLYVLYKLKYIIYFKFIQTFVVYLDKYVNYTEI